MEAAGLDRGRHPENERAEYQVRLAQKGDRRAREALLQAFLPLVAKACLRFYPSVHDYRYDELFSAGAVALNAAIDRFDPHRGVPFAVLARTVVHRRLVDQYRRQVRSREQPEAPEHLTPATDSPGRESVDAWIEAEGFAAEMKRYVAALRTRGLRLEDLAGQHRPRSAGLRHRLRVAGRGLARDPAFSACIRAGKPLPVRPLARRYGLSPHTIRRWEKFLVAVALAYLEPLPHLQEYLDELCRSPLT